MRRVLEAFQNVSLRQDIAHRLLLEQFEAPAGARARGSTTSEGTKTLETPSVSDL